MKKFNLYVNAPNVLNDDKVNGQKLVDFTFYADSKEEAERIVDIIKKEYNIPKQALGLAGDYILNEIESKVQ